MKKTLVIGSTVVDIIIGVKSLPKTQEDTHTTFHKMNLGGCAYNVSEILRQSKTPYILCSPVDKWLQMYYTICTAKKFEIISTGGSFYVFRIKA